MKKKRKIFKIIFRILFVGTLLVAGFVVFANWKIEKDTKDFVFDDLNQIPAQKAALVLGTARYSSYGENAYFVYRINAAKDLYDAEKVEAFVLSGDHGKKDYNEPEDMRNALIIVGIPDSVIYLDYAGFRTLDSVIRMKEIFGQNAFIVVSQRFHNERAVFLARHYGLEAYGFNARDVESGYSFKTKLREKFARAKVFIDILIGKNPKFLGEPVIIK